MKTIISTVFMLIGLTLNAQLKKVQVTDQNDKILEVGYINERGNKDSLWYGYNDDGRIVSEMEYSNGKKNGIWRLYNDEGDLIFKVLYIDGIKREGKQWDDRGRLIDYRKWDSEEHLLVQTIRRY
jgi:antitoxin component YwqK of YwqJK toxin-antitoxin module